MSFCWFCHATAQLFSFQYHLIRVPEMKMLYFLKFEYLLKNEVGGGEGLLKNEVGGGEKE